MDRIISNLLFASGIYNTKTKDINVHLQSHPEYPSLRSITDTLDYFNINNIAVKVDKSSLSQLPKMFVAHLSGEFHMDFALVHRLKNKIRLTWQDGNSHNVSIEEFKARWNGTLLAVENDEEQKPSFIQQLVNANILAALPIICILLLLWYYLTSVPALCFSLLSLVGLITSYFIQKESLGIGDSTVAKVCSAINTNSEGCEAVIKSDESKVFGISLGDLSLVYFASLLMVTSFLGIDSYMFYTISGLSLFAVGYTVYVQMMEIKNWCFLCLVVSTVLISQFAILHFWVQQSAIQASVLVVSLGILIVVISSWKAIKSIWQNAIELTEVKADLLGFKKNSDFFFQALDKNKIILSNKINETYSIAFGSENPSIELIAITNPTCGYCDKAFEAYDYLLSKFSKDIRIEFVFSVSTERDNNSNIVASKIIEIYQSDRSKAYKAMSDWFRNKDVDLWTSKYGSPNSENEYPQHCILSHTEWSRINNIIYTPETIFGESVFPKSHFDIKDLEFFVEVIKEAQKVGPQLDAIA